MKIEWHTHVYPPEEAAAAALAWDGKSGPTWAGKCPMTVENVLDAHHRAGLDVSVVSNAAHYMRGKSEAEELKAIQRWSDYAADRLHVGYVCRPGVPEPDALPDTASVRDLLQEIRQVQNTP